MPVGKPSSYRAAPPPSPKESGGGSKGDKEKPSPKESGGGSKGDTDRQKSQAGKTAKQHLNELAEKSKAHDGPDLRKIGWTCRLEKRTHDALGPDPVFLCPEGKEFHRSKEVLRHLGLKAIRLMTREEAYEAARAYQKNAIQEDPLPKSFGPITIQKLGKIEYQRAGFHSHRNIFPVGFISTYTDPDSSILYESEIIDGATLDEEHAEKVRGSRAGKQHVDDCVQISCKTPLRCSRPAPN
jgi:hypothetical protein